MSDAKCAPQRRRPRSFHLTAARVLHVRVCSYHIPELAVTIGRTREQSGAVEVDVAVVDGTLVAVEGSQTLAVLHPPHVRLVVLGAREKKVTLAVVLNSEKTAGMQQHQCARGQRSAAAVTATASGGRQDRRRAVRAEWPRRRAPGSPSVQAERVAARSQRVSRMH